MYNSLLLLAASFILLARFIGVEGQTGVGQMINCTAPRSFAICAQYIRPYSDNAYVWQDVCELSAVTSALIADDVEMYSYSYGCDIDAGYEATCCAGFGGCANGVDCTGPETALPTPPTADDIHYYLPNNWQVAVWCAVDNAARVLANPIVAYLPDNTPYQCISLCISKGYQWAGVEYADECYCGTGFVDGVTPPSGDDSDCDMRCSGDYGQLCGGSWRMQIFKAPGV